MNLSGRSVESLLRLYQLSPSELLVVTDDMDLPVGRLRLRATGSAGGHNGLRSLIDELGTQEFARLRIGVGRPAGDQAIRHVLGKFEPDEREPIQAAIERAADAVEVAVGEGLSAAMDRFNVRASRQAGPEASAAED
jgi:PTH1 family peptidyl-tRNA hydrolase